MRTVTIGSAAVITRHQATIVARRVLAYAQVWLDPATDRKRIRSAPRFDNFLKEYWDRWSPKWKPSTYETQTQYRALYLDRAFSGVFIDELNEAHVTSWFADLKNRTGPGAANRTLGILAGMLNKAESWGYRLENTNPCSVRPNRRRQCERFLSRAELERLGQVLAEERTGGDPPHALAMSWTWDGEQEESRVADGDDLVDRKDGVGRLRDGIYVLRLDDSLMVKRLARNPSGRGISIRSDNPNYPSWQNIELGRIDIVGRALWFGRTLS